jgi:hypothetical protein
VGSTQFKFISNSAQNPFLWFDLQHPTFVTTVTLLSESCSEGGCGIDATPLFELWGSNDRSFPDTDATAVLSVTVTSENIADGGDWTGEKVDRTLKTLKRKEGEEKRRWRDRINETRSEKRRRDMQTCICCLCMCALVCIGVYWCVLD